MALAISQAENGTRQCDRVSPANKNGTHDTGVFQINDVHLKKGYTREQFKDCDINIQIAYDIFKASGWHAWSTYKNKSYIKFLR